VLKLRALQDSQRAARALRQQHEFAALKQLREARAEAAEAHVRRRQEELPLQQVLGAQCARVGDTADAVRLLRTS
jgi:hypothetical protein